MPVCSLLWFAQLTFWNHYKHVSISPPLQPEFPDSFKKNPTKTNKNQLNGNICLQSHYTEPNPAEPETKAEVTWAAFWSCSAESGHTWGLSSFESISPLPWCSTMGNNYWRNVWLNRFISSLCFYFQKRRGSSVTWLEGKEMQIWKHTCNSPFLLWWKGAGATSYCTTATHCRIKQASLNEHRHSHLPFSSTLPNYFLLNRSWEELSHHMEGYWTPPAHPSSATSVQQNILHVVLLAHTRSESNKLCPKSTLDF